MSRVFRGERYVNMPHHRADITAPSKVVRVHCEGEDYHNADSLTSWLFMKYDMSFKTYRGKSKQRRMQAAILQARTAHRDGAISWIRMQVIIARIRRKYRRIP